MTMQTIKIAFKKVQFYALYGRYNLNMLKVKGWKRYTIHRETIRKLSNYILILGKGLKTKILEMIRNIL